MLQVVDEKAEAMKNELQNYRGWLPFQFSAYYSLFKRKRFLQSAGLWEEVHNKDLEVMQGIRDHKPNEDVYLDKLLRQWLVDNPKFSNLVVEI